MSPVSDIAPTLVTPAPTFLTTVGAPLIWIGVGYLLATLVQRPRRAA